MQNSKCKNGGSCLKCCINGIKLNENYFLQNLTASQAGIKEATSFLQEISQWTNK